MREIEWEYQFEDFGNEYSVAASFNGELGLIRHHKVIPCLKANEIPPKDVVSATKVIVTWELEIILRDAATKLAEGVFKNNNHQKLSTKPIDYSAISELDLIAIMKKCEEIADEQVLLMYPDGDDWEFEKKQARDRIISKEYKARVSR